MKTINKFTAILATSLLFTALVGCGGGEGGGGNKPKNGWSDEEKALLNEHFYGVEEEGLPYFACEELSTLTYNEDSNYLLATGGKPTTEYMQSYAVSLEDIGFRNISGTQGNYMYELGIDTEEGVRYAVVQYGFFNDEGSVDENLGTFNYIIQDIYDYEWSTITGYFELYNQFLEEMGHSACTAVLPEPEGATHYMWLSEYVMYGMFSVYAFNTNEASYETTLRNASYTITEQTDSDGETMTVAYNANEDTQVGIYDDTYENALVINVMPYIKPVAWPTEVINQYLADNEVEANIPAYTSLGEVFSYGYDKDGALYISTDGDATTQEEYNKLVVASGEWTNINDDEYTVADYGYLYLNADESVEIQFFAYQGTFMLMIYINTNAFQTGDWPSADITAFLASYDVEATIPALTGKGEIFRYAAIDASTEVDAQFVIIAQDDASKTLQAEYLALVQADSNWESANDSDYTVEDYDYIFLNKDNTVQLQFSTDYSAEDDTYAFSVYIFPLDGSQNVNPIVIADQADGSKLATLDFSALTEADDAYLSSYSAASYLSISFSIANGTNDPKAFYNGHNGRLYAGNTLTFTPASGTTITSIVIEADFSNKVITAADLSVVNADVTIVDNIVTITPLDGTSPIEISPQGSRKQLRMFNIKVSFTVA